MCQNALTELNNITPKMISNSIPWRGGRIGCTFKDKKSLPYNYFLDLTNLNLRTDRRQEKNHKQSGNVLNCPHEFLKGRNFSSSDTTISWEKRTINRTEPWHINPYSLQPTFNITFCFLSQQFNFHQLHTDLNIELIWKYVTPVIHNVLILPLLLHMTVHHKGGADIKKMFPFIYLNSFSTAIHKKQNRNRQDYIFLNNSII